MAGDTGNDKGLGAGENRDRKNRERDGDRHVGGKREETTRGAETEMRNERHGVMRVGERQKKRQGEHHHPPRKKGKER